LGLRGLRYQRIRENYIMRSFIIGTAHQILFGTSNREMRWAGQVASMGENRGGGETRGKETTYKTQV
jgi:hypothetical protein